MGETEISQWKALYTISGICALIMVALIPLQIIVYLIWRIPETAIESFLLFQENKLYGLLSLELLYLISNVLSLPLFPAMYTVLKTVNKPVMAIATILGLISAGLIFTARPTFDMLYLSNQYASATTDVQRAIFLAAGEAKLTLIYGTAQQAHYVLGSLALLFISIVMLRSEVFPKTTAYFGLIANVLVFGLYLPVIGVYLSILSVFPFTTLWLILVGIQLLKLARTERKISLEPVEVIPKTSTT